MTEVPGIAGTGRALPAAIRTNDDPIFDRLRGGQVTGSDRFHGYRERRVLGPGDSLTQLMVQAARAALDAADCEPGGVDLLLGYGSLARYIAPNDLASVHAELGLPPHAAVIPLADEYTVFGSSLLVADALIRTDRASRALIVCGCNWTSVVDYTTAPSISAGDGAGAAVVQCGGAPPGRPFFRIVAGRSHTASGYYGAMFLAPDAAGAPHFAITDAGYDAMAHFVRFEVPAVARRLLDEQGVHGDQVTLLCHQTTQWFLDEWAAALGPKELLHTLAEYGNMTSASLPVNLDVFAERISTDYVLLLGIGIQWQAQAVLLARA